MAEVEVCPKCNKYVLGLFNCSGCNTSVCNSCWNNRYNLCNKCAEEKEAKK